MAKRAIFIGVGMLLILAVAGVAVWYFAGRKNSSAAAGTELNGSLNAVEGSPENSKTLISRATAKLL